MTEFIVQRVNTLSELRQIYAEYGVELDLRGDPAGRIYIRHSSLVYKEAFEPYAEDYRKNHAGTMVLNVTGGGIEHNVLETVRRYGIKNYFLLCPDLAMTRKLADGGEQNIAVRISGAGDMDTVRAMAGKVRWAWMDTIPRLPADRVMLEEMKRLGYRLCLALPGLQARPEEIERCRQRLVEKQVEPDAICMDRRNIGKWKSIEPIL